MLICVLLFDGHRGLGLRPITTVLCFALLYLESNLSRYCNNFGVAMHTASCYVGALTMHTGETGVIYQSPFT